MVSISFRASSTARILSPIHRTTGTAIEFPSALQRGPSAAGLPRYATRVQLSGNPCRRSHSSGVNRRAHPRSTMSRDARPGDGPVLAISVPAISFHTLRTFGGVPRKLSRSNSTAAGLAKFPRCPTRKTLRRCWGTPKPEASSTRQAAEYPSFSRPPRKVPKSRPAFDDRTPRTFSQTIQRGRTRSTTARYVSVRLPRGSSSPPLSPDMLNDWQGLPPIIMSTDPQYSLQSAFVTSPRFGTLGKRCARTAHGKRSISANAKGLKPSGSQATEAASIPANSDKYLIFAPYHGPLA